MDIRPTAAATLLDLPWEDIIFDKIFVYFTIAEICIIRAVSNSYYNLIKHYMQYCQELDFSYSRITEESFIALTSSCKKLKIFSVSGCRNLKGNGLLSLFKNNKHLKSVSMNNCNFLTNFHIKTIGRSNDSDIRILNIGDCPGLNSEGLQFLIMNLYNLEELDIRGCLEVDTKTLNSIFLKYPNLRELNLSRIEAVDDDALIMLSKKCRKLMTLRLSRCWRITENGVLKVLEWCPLLRKLDIRFCPKISQGFLYIVSLKGLDLHTKIVRPHRQTLTLNVQT